MRLIAHAVSGGLIGHGGIGWAIQGSAEDYKVLIIGLLFGVLASLMNVTAAIDKNTETKEQGGCCK